jgi:hypothetical protein
VEIRGAQARWRDLKRLKGPPFARWKALAGKCQNAGNERAPQRGSKETTHGCV